MGGKYNFGFRVALLVLCALCEASVAFFPCMDDETSTILYILLQVGVSLGLRGMERVWVLLGLS